MSFIGNNLNSIWSLWNVNDQIKRRLFWNTLLQGTFNGTNLIETLHENFVMLMQLCIKLTLLIVLHPHYLQHPMIFAIEQVIKSKINQQICKLNGFCEDDRFYIDNFYR